MYSLQLPAGNRPCNGDAAAVCACNPGVYSGRSKPGGSSPRPARPPTCGPTTLKGLPGSGVGAAGFRFMPSKQRQSPLFSQASCPGRLSAAERNGTTLRESQQASVAEERLGQEDAHTLILRWTGGKGPLRHNRFGLRCRFAERTVAPGPQSKPHREHRPLLTPSG
jgi:hypothetical protein